MIHEPLEAPADIPKVSTGLTATILRGSLISMAVRFVGMAMALSCNVLLSRLLGPAGYGSYVIALGWAMLIAILARLGLDHTALRFATAYREEDRLGDLRGLWIFSVRSITALSCLFLVVLLLAKWAGASQLAAIPTMMLIGVAGLSWTTATMGWYSALVRTAHCIVASQAFEQVVRPAILSAAIGMGVLFGARLDATTAMLLTVLSGGVALLMITFRAKKSFHLTEQKVALFSERREWLSVGLALVVMALFQESLNQIEVIFFGILSNASSAALFSVAARLSVLIPFGLKAIMTMSAPMIASAFRRGDMRELARISHVNARFSLAFALVFALVLAVAGRPVLRLFGPTFDAAYPALLILLAGGLINAFTGSVANVLTMTGKHFVAMVIFGAALALSAVLNFLLIPTFGTIGGAIASVSGITFWNLTMLAYVRLTYGIDVSAFGFPTRSVAP